MNTEIAASVRDPGQVLRIFRDDGRKTHKKIGVSGENRTPVDWVATSCLIPFSHAHQKMAPPTRIEPATSGLTSQRSAT